MKLQDAINTCHVRSAIYRASLPGRRFWKNTLDFKYDAREYSAEDQKAVDWQEYDPYDGVQTAGCVE